MKVGTTTAEKEKIFEIAEDAKNLLDVIINPNRDWKEGQKMITNIIKEKELYARTLRNDTSCS